MNARTDLSASTISRAGNGLNTVTPSTPTRSSRTARSQSAVAMAVSTKLPIPTRAYSASSSRYGSTRAKRRPVSAWKRSMVAVRMPGRRSVK